MTSDGTRVPANDLLTRTTLQMDENVSPRASWQMLNALKRVPGVLLAEISAGGARAIVAHDAAVPSASLLQAAARTGVVVKLIADTREPVARVAMARPLVKMPIQRFLICAAVSFFLLTLIEATSPRLVNNHFLLPLLLSWMWAFIIARAMFSRRP